MRIAPLFVALTLLGAAACADAKPGVRPNDGGMGGAADGGGGAGSAPDFTQAVPTALVSPATEPDAYGGAVAVAGETVLVSAKRDFTVASPTGAVHVYVKEGAGWTPQAQLKALAPEPGDEFGESVAIAGNIALVGARGRGNPDYSGAGFALHRNGTSWVAQHELRQDPPVANTEMGAAVGLSGTLALVGLPNTFDVGRVLWFELIGTEWLPAGEAIAPQSMQRFGQAVALDGDTAVIGAPGFGVAGTAYVFVRQDGSWVQQAELTPGDGAAGLHFGRSVALSGGTAVVGTGDVVDPGNGSGTDLGTAYVFVRNGSSWTQQWQFFPDDGAPGNAFGVAVAISGDAALIGASHDDEAGMSAGAAYLFARTGTSWAQQTKLLHPNAAADDRFGISVALDGKVAVIGALNASTLRGSATLFVAP